MKNSHVLAILFAAILFLLGALFAPPIFLRVSIALIALSLIFSLLHKKHRKDPNSHE